MSSSAEILSEKKLDTVWKAINRVEGIVGDLCSIRRDIFETQKEEWDIELKNIKDNLKNDQILLFTGMFNSGKSTFINSLLGEDLLPTANRPCTSIITELSFKRGGGHEGKAVKFDMQEEDMDFKELIKRIDDPNAPIGTLGMYRHIVLRYDILELPEKQREGLDILANLNLRIVDTPGFGGTFTVDEEIIYDYIERASFTFWMSPADKFGGGTMSRVLDNISGKTTTLIPVITKADLIADEDQRKTISEDFFEHLGGKFKSLEPRFLSAHKFRQAIDCDKKLSGYDTESLQRTKEEKLAFETEAKMLRDESGVETIYKDIMKRGQKASLNDAALTLTLSRLAPMIKRIDQIATNEEGYWYSRLQEKEWSPNDKYRELNMVKEKLRSWIESESERVAKRIEHQLKVRLYDYILESKGKVDSGRIKGITCEIWQDELTSKISEWAKHFADEYHNTCVPLPGNDSNFKTPELGTIKAELEIRINAFMTAIGYAGGKSILLASLGAVTVSAGTLSGLIPVVGSAVASVLNPIGIVVGPVLMAIAAAPLYSAYADDVKRRKERYLKEVEAKLDDWMRKLDTQPQIYAILDKQNENLYKQYRGDFDKELHLPMDKYEMCKDIKKNIKELRESLKSNFAERFNG